MFKTGMIINVVKAYIVPWNVGAVLVRQLLLLLPELGLEIEQYPIKYHYQSLDS